MSDETVANDLDEVGTVETGTGTMTEAKYLGLKDAETMTELSMCDIQYLDALEQDSYHLRSENIELKKSIGAKCPNEKTLNGDDELVKLYTGLASFATLMAIFNFVSAHVSSTCTFRSLPLFQQFLLVLMKLRLNLFDKDLAYRFGTSQTSVSRYFTKWIEVMFIRLHPLVRWPRREELQLTMPAEFRKHFKKCVAIIDCFEVFCERPKSLKARAQTWSNYKHHNTVKFSVAITPQGAISFVSKGWGGRASDQHITENCGILSHLLPGDQILADRGFNVE